VGWVLSPEWHDFHPVRVWLLGQCLFKGHENLALTVHSEARMDVAGREPGLALDQVHQAARCGYVMPEGRSWVGSWRIPASSSLLQAAQKCVGSSRGRVGPAGWCWLQTGWLLWGNMPASWAPWFTEQGLRNRLKSPKALS
jgi:hypothetical protein